MLQLSLFTPDTGWTPKPQIEWPDFKGVKYLGVDIEGYDPNLEKRGPGYLRKDAYVAGVSLASPDGRKIYLPFAHSEGNVDPDQAKRYIKEQLSRSDQIKVGANIMYDVEGLNSLGIEVKGKWYDIQIAEPLLEEEKPNGFSLEVLAQEYLGVGKTTEALDRALIDHGLWTGTKKKPKPDRGKIALLPSKYVGPYAEDDALYPIKIIQHQLRRLNEEDLIPVWDLETNLLPILWKMRRHGVKVDVERAHELAKDTRVEEHELVNRMCKLANNNNLDPSDNAYLTRVFNKFDLPVRRTAAGNPTFKAEYLIELQTEKIGSAEAQEFIATLLDWRRMVKMRRDFIEGVVINQSVNGRLHPNWHPLREQEDSDPDADATGTRSGRIASTKPNLTQIPSRHKRWGPLVRGLFLPDDGGRWCKHDYSQQEPRILLHFAYIHKFAGAAEVRQRFIDDPRTDYHQMVADVCKERTGTEIGRRPAKTINLGLAYGMGLPKLVWQLKQAGAIADSDEARMLFAVYHRGVPYVKQCGDHYAKQAMIDGYVTTILGRRRRFNSWEPVWTKQGENFVAIYGFEKACAFFGGPGKIRRAFTHKALNAKVQGSAADQMKSAIVALDAEGLTPQIQVYDELNHTVYDDAQVKRIGEIMRDAIPMTVPFKVDPIIADNWGAAKDD